MYFRFLAKFNEVYAKPLTSVFSAADRDWLSSILMRELEVKDEKQGQVSKDAYDGLCKLILIFKILKNIKYKN